MRLTHKQGRANSRLGIGVYVEADERSLTRSVRIVSKIEIFRPKTLLGFGAEIFRVLMLDVLPNLVSFCPDITFWDEANITLLMLDSTPEKSGESLLLSRLLYLRFSFDFKFGLIETRLTAGAACVAACIAFCFLR